MQQCWRLLEGTQNRKNSEVFLEQEGGQSWFYELVTRGPMSELLSPIADVGGTWLQLMCCALPKCLCP